MSEAGKLLQIRVGEHLRELRDKRKMSLQQVADAAGSSSSTINRTEHGQRLPTRDELTALCTVYGVTGKEKLLLIQRATELDNNTAWLETTPSEREQQTAMLKMLEQKASAITLVHNALIPGLLQTDEYARCMIGTQAGWSEEIDELVGARLSRQAVLSRTRPPQVRVLLDESTLHRTLGASRVLGEQLERLLVIQRREHVTLRILSYASSAHPALDGAFGLYELPDGSAHVFVESAHFGLFLTEPEEVTAYVESRSDIEQRALSEESSVELIKYALEQLDAK